MLVSTETRGHTLIVTLNRPDKRNAINAEVAAGIDAALNRLEDDPALWVGILTGGTEWFCAGTDLKETAGPPTPRGGNYGVIRRERVKPLIAAVEGFALGGGFEVVMACDLVVAAKNARFGLPESRRGVIPTCGGLFRTARILPLNVANEMAILCEPMSAERLHHFGVVNTLTEPGGALEAAVKMAETIALNSPVSVRESLRAMRTVSMADDWAAWLATEKATEVIKASEDRAEGVKAFFEKRAPVWRGR